jgi:hypothetical protein
VYWSSAAYITMVDVCTPFDQIASGYGVRGYLRCTGQLFRLNRFGLSPLLSGAARESWCPLRDGLPNQVANGRRGWVQSFQIGAVVYQVYSIGGIGCDACVVKGSHS